MKPDETNVDIKITGTLRDDRPWGNWFFLESWTLHIDLTSEQHEVAAERLGIVRESTLLTGWFHDDIVLVRDEGDWELKRPVCDIVKSQIRILARK